MRQDFTDLTGIYKSSLQICILPVSWFIYRNQISIISVQGLRFHWAVLGHIAVKGLESFF